MSALLDPAFIRELEALRRHLVLRSASGSPGEHRARRRGGSAEFAEHRGYAPGDDLRRIDWMAFARTGEPVVKQFRADDDVLVRLLLDTSASVAGEKLDASLRVAAAIGYVGLASSERVQVLPFAAGLRAPSRPIRGRAGVPTLLRTLDALRAEGTTDLSSAISSAITRGRQGLLVVVSDFLDARGCDRALARAHAAGHDVVLVHVVSRDEIEPALRGDYLLEDAETGERLTVTVDAETVDAYRVRFDALCNVLQRCARSLRATYVRLACDERIDDAVRTILTGASNR